MIDNNKTSNLTLEEEILYYKNTLKDIQERKLKYPNDQELGKNIRKYLNK
jgi:hypothetical protein